MICTYCNKELEKVKNNSIFTYSGEEYIYVNSIVLFDIPFHQNCLKPFVEKLAELIRN